jgi:hypothetical protein
MMKKVATFNYQGSQTGQEVIFDFFFYVKPFENLAGVEINPVQSASHFRASQMCLTVVRWQQDSKLSKLAFLCFKTDLTFMLVNNDIICN